MNSYIQDNYVKDKVIIITGASSGFGAATARKAAEMGGKVVLAARRADRLEALEKEIREKGGEALAVPTDVRVKEQVFALAKKTLDTYGRIDVLVNDAGTMPIAYFSEHEWALPAWEECLDTAIKGTLYGICAVFDQMMYQEQGHIINVSSILGNYPVMGCGVYNVSKVAVRYLAESLRVETRGKIKTTTVRPSSVSQTELLNTVVDYTAAGTSTYGKFFEAMAKNPMTVPGYFDRDSIQLYEPTPEDIADNIIYAINQPWGVDISDVTVRASNESMLV